MKDLLTPMSEEDFARQRFSALCKVALGAILAMIAFSAAHLMPSWAMGWKAVTIAVVFVTLFRWIADWSDSLRQGKPLDGEGCSRLHHLAGEHPEIAALVAQVRAMGRPVAWADLWQANGWLYQQERAAEARACCELNGIATS